jgi:2-iminobutanoate/2-iminopropanoate deaminase
MTHNPPGCPPPPFPYSLAVVAGPLVFVSGQVATDFGSGIAAEAAVNPRHPYAGPEAVVRQARYIFKNLGRLLDAAGSSLDGLVRIEQWVTTRSDGPPYFRARNEFLTADRPTSSMLVGHALELPDARIVLDGIGVAKGGPWAKETFVTDKIPVNVRAGYSLAQRTGPFVFLPGNTASDFTTGIHPEARVDHTFWFERDVVMQTQFILKTRRILLEEMGLSLADVVQATIYLTDMEDLPALEHTWAHHFPVDGPAVTIVPVDELAVRGSVVEISVIALDRARGVRRRTIGTTAAPPPVFPGPQAVHAGPYLFIAGQVAADASGLLREAEVHPAQPYYASPMKLQARAILANVERICEAAGGTRRDLVKCQAYVTHFDDLVPYFEVWGEIFPAEPPASTVVGVKPPLLMPGCRVLQSWIAYLP